MDIILLALVVGALCIISFINGAKVGQTVAKGEKVETLNINPIKAYKEHKANKETEIEQDKLSIILKNIERYDGTSRGQEDVG